MPDATSRASRFLGWLTGTRVGRAALGGLVLKAVVQFLRPLVGSNSAIEGLDVLASVVLVVMPYQALPKGEPSAVRML